MRGKVGRPRRRPQIVTADRGYDHDKYRRELRARRIKPEIARRQTEHCSGLGRYRWVVERTLGWLAKRRSLRTRWCKKPDNWLAFIQFACAHILMSLAIYG